MQAKDVPDEAVIEAIRSIQNAKNIAHRWDVEAAFPQVPPKVVFAKLCSLKRRGVIWAECLCGRKGSFQLPDHPASVPGLNC
jgi:hypothetical protein